MQVTRTNIKSWMSLISGQIGIFTSELFTLERPKEKNPIDLWRKCCPAYSIFTFDQIIFKLAGNQGSHKTSDKIEFWLDQTIHVGLTCPWVTENTIFDLIRSIAFLFLIGSLWNLQITWTCIKSWMSSTSGQIGLLTLELLVSAETLHIWLCPGYILISFNWNFMKLADNSDRHKISKEFDFQADLTIDFGVTCPLVPKQNIFHLVQSTACLVLI